MVECKEFLTGEKKSSGIQKKANPTFLTCAAIGVEVNRQIRIGLVFSRSKLQPLLHLIFFCILEANGLPLKVEVIGVCVRPYKLSRRTRQLSLFFFFLLSFNGLSLAPERGARTSKTRDVVIRRFNIVCCRLIFRKKVRTSESSFSALAETPN